MWHDDYMLPQIKYEGTTDEIPIVLFHTSIFSKVFMCLALVSY